MAIQTQTLDQAEHDWFRTHSGVAVSAPLNEHKRAYFISKNISGTAGGGSKPTHQMEIEWLASVPTVTPPNNIGIADLWQRVLGNMGITATPILTENKRAFFSTVTVSP